MDLRKALTSASVDRSSIFSAAFAAGLFPICRVCFFRKRMLDASRLAENAKKYHTGQQERFCGKSMFYAINGLQTNSKRPSVHLFRYFMEEMRRVCFIKRKRKDEGRGRKRKGRGRERRKRNWEWSFFRFSQSFTSNFPSSFPFLFLCLSCLSLRPFANFSVMLLKLKKHNWTPWGYREGV